MFVPPTRRAITGSRARAVSRSVAPGDSQAGSAKQAMGDSEWFPEWL